MNHSHAKAGGIFHTHAEQILQDALSHTNGIDHQIISDLRADLILLLQEQKELQLHSNIDVWKFVLEMNHCLNVVGSLLEIEKERNF